jgi:hypothetical protein
MKKKLLFILLLTVLVLPISVDAKEKVKVYIFEAGGCPACAGQMEYLKGLSGYNKDFEVIEKEAYVDHIDWEQGKDFDLDVKVAEAFYNAGYQDATAYATPFVVVSNFYAAANYNSSLETVINEAAEKGDKDVVGCFEAGKTDCADLIEKKEGATTTPSTDSKKETSVDNTGNIVAICVISGIFVVAVTVISVKKNNSK